MTEWRKARQANSKARQARLEEKKKKEIEESPPSPPPMPTDYVKQLPINTAPAPETTILMPQPLSPPANDLQDHVKTNGLDFADFDNDTSSPFDNMELKTINDMEELAQVSKASIAYYFININNLTTIERLTLVSWIRMYFFSFKTSLYQRNSSNNVNSKKLMPKIFLAN